MTILGKGGEEWGDGRGEGRGGGGGGGGGEGGNCVYIHGLVRPPLCCVQLLRLADKISPDLQICSAAGCDGESLGTQIAIYSRLENV